MTDIIDNMQVTTEQIGQRLDQVVAKSFANYSRSRLQSWIKSGQILVNGQVKQPKYSVCAGDQVKLEAKLEEDIEWQAVPQAINILYADNHLIIVDKTANLVVHPAAGHKTDTLVNALLVDYPELKKIPRAGIVHRIDKDTSGVLMIARSLIAHQSLVAQLEARSVEREYQTIVQGVPIAGGTIKKPVGRHPKNRIKMAIRTSGGKHATTHFRVTEKFRGHALLTVKLETGRTHQIRVHMASEGYSILGDPLYGSRLKIPAHAGLELADNLRQFKRQALHARRLGIIHPADNTYMEWNSELPEDMRTSLDLLRNDAEELKNL